MNSLLSTGRLFTRAIWNGISNISTATEPNVQRKEPYLVSAVCGFSKERKIKRLINGQFGDDAWFVTKTKTSDVLGVADGVGGWRTYGIDPGEFSYHLMRTCERLVRIGHFHPANPRDLLAKSYFELLHHKKSILGSSTACVVILNREQRELCTANIGDSGFMVVRAGRLLYKSEEQQHYFNTPFQLSLPPPDRAADVLSDRPDAAATSTFPVQDGDVILVATDGVFDNLPDNFLIRQLIEVQGERSAGRLQMVANSIAWMARNLSHDAHWMSPFAVRARANGINTIGGKPDDITVILATVAI